MILIAHRGNTNGPEPKNENSPEYIEAAIESGYDAEIDIRLHAGELYLGHDDCQYKVVANWLLRNKHRLWCHAKDLPVFRMLLDLNMHTFIHDKDPAALTSKHYVWTNPEESLVSNAILVMPKTTTGYNLSNIAGVCSDYISHYNY
tara:strand:+ start:1855 stop:2292 length:438 start_codon:yes stop_codon:yes gene_type:complete